jgi:hypothetical protein
LAVGGHKARLASGVARFIAGRVPRRGLFGLGDAIALPSTAPVTIELELGISAPGRGARDSA